ncbi:MAG: prephenate dehydratase [Proteobacteria bacterium]|nr:prephenate dehydratase [Pseudomonadota bacterium]MBU1714566.1 prephenate dehydratase [Pseudomonadota bacterium]
MPDKKGKKNLPKSTATSGKKLSGSDSGNSVIDVRNKIDAIDDQILKLLKKRLNCAKKIGQLKEKGNKAKWDPLRERQIFSRLSTDNQGEFPEQSLDSIFHEIITTCRLSQKEVAVAYLGPEATFSHLAGVKYFGTSAKYRPVETIEDIFLEVERERIEYGIVPVENSIEGSVTSTLDSFIKYRVKICGELHLGIKHHLINQSGEIKDIKLIASHSQPLAQCRQWLKKNLPEIPCQSVFSTGVASKMAAEDPTIAAIASSLAIKTYHLQTVISGIEDYRGNTTRFLLIGKESPSRSGNDKTSLLVSLLDRPGALNDALRFLADRDINLTRIESRPVKNEPGNYLFFLDMLGHLEDNPIREGCEKLKQVCSSYEWLGSYPRSKS